MKYALANMLNGYSVRGLDPDAKAYIDAVVAAGATVTGTERNAINAFVKGGKTDGWWSSMRRIYFPIWGAASRNAIDMIGRTSGTFSGVVTHASGYVQGNGSSGYFIGSALSTLSLSNTSVGVHLLISQADTTSMPGYVGGYTSASSFINVEHQPSPERIRFDAFQGSTAANATLAKASQNGVLSFVRDSGNVRISRRGSTGATLLLNSSIASGGSVPSTTIKFMVGEFAGLYGYSNARWGCWAVSSSISNALTDNFSSSLKTLWETCTGLTLP